MLKLVTVLCVVALVCGKVHHEKEEHGNEHLVFGHLRHNVHEEEEVHEVSEVSHEKPLQRLESFADVVIDEDTIKISIPVSLRKFLRGKVDSLTEKKHQRFVDLEIPPVEEIQIVTEELMTNGVDELSPTVLVERSQLHGEQSHGEQSHGDEEDVIMFKEFLPMTIDEVVTPVNEVSMHEEDFLNHEEDFLNHEEDFLNHEEDLLNHEEDLLNHEELETVGELEGEILENDGFLGMINF